MFGGAGSEATFALWKVRPGETPVELGAKEFNGIGGGRWKFRDQPFEKIINGCFERCHVLPPCSVRHFCGPSDRVQ